MEYCNENWINAKKHIYRCDTLSKSLKILLDILAPLHVRYVQCMGMEQNQIAHYFIATGRRDYSTMTFWNICFYIIDTMTAVKT